LTNLLKRFLSSLFKLEMKNKLLLPVISQLKL
jgi:hypothetical protein